MAKVYKGNFIYYKKKINNFFYFLKNKRRNKKNIFIKLIKKGSDVDSRRRVKRRNAKKIKLKKLNKNQNLIAFHKNLSKRFKKKIYSFRRLSLYSKLHNRYNLNLSRVYRRKFLKNIIVNNKTYYKNNKIYNIISKIKDLKMLKLNKFFFKFKYNNFKGYNKSLNNIFINNFNYFKNRKKKILII